jgi:N-methylhydantoinase A
VTDAHVVLGHLPEDLLGGRMTLDAQQAREAIRRRVAEPLGLSVEEAARGVLAILDSNMVGALRVVSVERGHDPRQFTLVAFGGAGPLHGCSLADLLQVPRVMIPTAPGVLCADGLLAADLKAEFSRTLPKAGPVEMGQASAIFAELGERADDWLAAENVAPSDRAQSRMALMRYRGQGSEIAVDWGDTRRAEEAEAAFAAAHETLYGFRLGAPIELVTLRVEGAGRIPRPHPGSLPLGAGVQPVARRQVHFAAGSREVPIYQRDGFGAGDRLAGPALVTQLDTTTLVPPGWALDVHTSGALLLTRA